MLSVSAFDIADLRRRGFVGFKPDYAFGYHQPPHLSGIYVVARDATDAPTFLDRSPASWFHGKDPTVSIERLEAEWVADAQTLYVDTTANSLRERIGLFVAFSNAGRDRSVPAMGGRLLWQLADAQKLLLAWKPCRDYEDLKADLIDEFVEAYRRLPFANLVKPRGSRKTMQRTGLG
jgi:hypothetical protein